VNNLPENRPPQITVKSPDRKGEEADTEFIIQWQASDEDGDTLAIDLFYDTDRDPEDNTTLIATGLGNTGSYEWDCSGAPEGDFYILAVADDGNGSRASGYSPGVVRIFHEGENHEPDMEVLSVSLLNEFTLEILWSAEDADGEDPVIDLYYDTDTDPGDGLVLIEADLENTGRYLWDISGMEDGDYHILGTARDREGGETGSYSEQFTIILPERQPDFSVLAIEFQPRKAREGDLVTILVTVRNEGDGEGEAMVGLFVDGVLLESQQLSLGPGEDTIVRFTWNATEGSHRFGAGAQTAGDPEPENNEMEESFDITEGSSDDDENNVELLYLSIVGILAGVAIIGGVLVHGRLGKRGTCPDCGSRTTYYGEYDDFYCEECGDYVGEG